MVAECAALAVGSSLLGPLLAPLIGLSVPLAALFASCTVPPGVTGIAARAVTGLGLGVNNDWTVEYAWTDRRSIGDTHMSSRDTRPRDSTRPGVLWHLPMATADFAVVNYFYPVTVFRFQRFNARDLTIVSRV